MSASVDGDSTKAAPEGSATATAGPSEMAAAAATVSASSSTSSFPNVKVAVVTTKRKEELLLKARAERRHWIEKVPLPYRSVSQQERQISGTGGGNNASNSNSLGNDLWAVSSVSTTSNDGSSLYKVKSSVVCQKYLPTATNVISELYGLPTVTTGAATTSSVPPVEPVTGPLGLMQVAERIETLVKPYVGDESGKSPQDESDENGGDNEDANKEESDKSSTDTITSHPEVFQAYQNLWTSLLWPESSVLVQGMKNFIFHWKQNHFNGDYDDKPPSLSAAATSLNNYCKSTVDSILKSNRNLVGTSEDSSKLRRSLESFMYGQARDILQKAIDDELELGKQQEDSEAFSSMTPSQLEERLLELQFVQPSHLEIACLQDTVSTDDSADDTDNNENDKLQELLKEPIRALLSMDAYHSPYEKLEQILLVYQGVNAALSTALNQDMKDGAASVLPSADDVLPTCILVCLKARPRNLLQNLQFIEQFAAPEYLRGEAGYAYTNLYGAVQFLQDLDLKHSGDEEGDGDAVSSNHLSISKEDLKKGLEKCRKQRDEMLAATKKATSSTATTTGSVGNPLVDGTGLPVPLPSVKLSVQDVFTAHSLGETVDLEWAKKRQQQQQPQEAPITGSMPVMSKKANLPEGFKRSYTFLNAQPQDIRVTDLAQLLEEYHMLVHVTEELLSERAARIAAERKQRELEQQQALGEKLLLGD